mgnify:CR=1 FL=1
MQTNSEPAKTKSRAHLKLIRTPTVLLVDKAAKALVGSKLDDAALDAAAAACSAASSARSPERAGSATRSPP